MAYQRVLERNLILRRQVSALFVTVGLQPATATYLTWRTPLRLLRLIHIQLQVAIQTRLGESTKSLTDPATFD
jgi:hypothetical protein